MRAGSHDPSRDQTAITGIGITPLNRRSGKPVIGLALDAALAAIEDAGLQRSDIDGVVSYSVGDSASVRDVAQALGISPSNWYSDLFGGGSYLCAAIANAVVAITNGLCNHVLVYRALNGRSGRRLGRFQIDDPNSMSIPGADQFAIPMGLLGPAHLYALLARRHMIEYGTTERQLGTVAVQLRANAVENECAMMRSPITIDDYFSSRWIAEPFRLLDCCQETDGACAVVVSHSDRATDGPWPPVYISSFALGGAGAPAISLDRYNDYTTSFAAHIAPGLYHRAGIDSTEIDVAAIYDAFTFLVIVQLEDFGFCKKGEGGPFVEDGQIAPTGRIPVGTNGGLLSEGYVHGFNNLLEAVRQLRGRTQGRQVEGAQTALVSGWGANVGSALILRT